MPPRNVRLKTCTEFDGEKVLARLIETASEGTGKAFGENSWRIHLQPS
jgi:hypothetical protein